MKETDDDTVYQRFECRVTPPVKHSYIKETIYGCDHFLSLPQNTLNNLMEDV